MDTILKKESHCWSRMVVAICLTDTHLSERFIFLATIEATICAMTALVYSTARDVRRALSLESLLEMHLALDVPTNQQMKQTLNRPFFFPSPQRSDRAGIRP